MEKILILLHELITKLEQESPNCPSLFYYLSMNSDGRECPAIRKTIELFIERDWPDVRRLIEELHDLSKSC